MAVPTRDRRAGTLSRRFVKRARTRGYGVDSCHELTIDGPASRRPRVEISPNVAAK